MNNSVISRFTPRVAPIKPNIIQPPSMAVKIESPIIEPEKLREELSKAVNPIPTIETSNNSGELEFIKFDNVFEFVSWYELNKDKFTTHQQQPLDNLVAARNMATGGCNCDRTTRKAIADSWFQKFWVNNKNTDLPPTLLKIANSKKVVFGNFLTYP